jgi:hypothetical protein
MNPQICSTGERSFYVSPQQAELLRTRGAEFRLQLVAVQLDDANPFRFHWPLHAELHLNRRASCARAREALCEL